MASIEPETTVADMVYFLPPADGSRPYNNIAADVNSDAGGNCRRETHTNVPVENLRGKEDSVKLDTAGFQFSRRATKHISFSTDEDIEREYYPESAQLIKDLTGASKVVFFDHTVRRHRPGEVDDGPGKRQPVALVHVDQTPSSAIARVHLHLPPEDASKLLANRFQIINLWRPIGHAALDWPLALCNWQSVDTERDLVPVALVYPDREGETYGVKYNEAHRWVYLRGMEPDEVVLIKCFDSDAGVALFTPHTGFYDPTTPKDAPLRESIELRALVFYD